MIELVLTLCLSAAPADCRKERIPFDGSLLGCLIAGQTAAAAWVAVHPKWHLAAWRCGPVGRDA